MVRGSRRTIGGTGWCVRGGLLLLSVLSTEHSASGTQLTLSGRFFSASRRCLSLRGGVQGLNDLKDLQGALEREQKELKVEVSDQEGAASLGKILAEHKGINRLEIYGGFLTDLPPELWDLTELSTLILSKNAIESLSPDISRLSNLKCLELEENQIKELPAEISECSRLEVLNVAKNKIISLFPIVGNEALTTLRADYNNLQDDGDIPLSSLQRLKVLSLAGNELRELPMGLEGLNLELLNIADNSFEYLPAELGELKEKTLKTLKFDDNPLSDKNRLQKILSKSKKPIKEILEFVRKQSKGRKKEVKGQSNSATAVPKTTQKKSEQGHEKQQGAGQSKISRKFREAMARQQHLETTTEVFCSNPHYSVPVPATYPGQLSFSSLWQDDSSDDFTTSEKEDPKPVEEGKYGRVSADQAIDVEFQGSTEHITGVKHKTLAEQMVESGQAKDVNHARAIIRKRLRKGASGTAPQPAQLSSPTALPRPEPKDSSAKGAGEADMKRPLLR